MRKFGCKVQRTPICRYILLFGVPHTFGYLSYFDFIVELAIKDTEICLGDKLSKRVQRNWKTVFEDLAIGVTSSGQADTKMEKKNVEGGKIIL